MAKSFKNVVQDSPWTGLGIPVKSKKPLPRNNTPPVEPLYGFKHRGRLVPALRRDDSSVIRSLGTPFRGHTPVRQTDQPRQPGGGTPTERREQSSPPETQDRGCRPRCDYYWPNPLFPSRNPSGSLVYTTSVTNDSMNVQIRSNWSIRENRSQIEADYPVHSRSAHHAISSAVSQQACAFHPCGWPSSRERLPVDRYR